MIQTTRNHADDCTCAVCTQPRYRSVAAWASLFALVGLLLGTFGIYEKIGLSGTQFEKIVDTALSCLVAFGILNNPTSKDTF